MMHLSVEILSASA